MAGHSFDDPPINFDKEAFQRSAAKALRFGAILLALIFLFVIVTSSITPYVDYLWYRFDAHALQVFTTNYEARGTLMVAGWLVAWAFLGVNVKIALSGQKVYANIPTGIGAVAADFMEFLRSKGGRVIQVGTALLSLFFGVSLGNEWKTYLLFVHQQSFGTVDPLFHLDLGFYVFALPAWEAVANFAFGLATITLLVCFALHASGRIANLLSGIYQRASRATRHLAVLLAIWVLTLGLTLYLGTYDAGIAQGSQFTGVGYSASIGVSTTRILAILIMLTGVLVPVVCWEKVRVRPLVWLAGACVAWGILAVGIVPQVVQAVVVSPNRLVKEAPFAQRALTMTRFAYNLGIIETRKVTPTTEPSQAAISAGQVTLQNMRLWDPSVLAQSLDGLQGIRPYYAFNDVDVDRYPINGKETMVMLSARDLNLNGLDPTARNWINERLRYTHGYGVVVSRVNTATPDGQPILLDRDIPQVEQSELPAFEPRLYFSDSGAESGRDDYICVDTNQSEFDYQYGDQTQSVRWHGTRGIPLGSWIDRLALSSYLGDGNLLISSNIRSNSKLLMYRDVLTRAHRILPFLSFDPDPYIVMANGHLYWILDGYTTSDRIPYSKMLSDDSGSLNYIRNSVKVTIDAYSGDLNAYSMDDSEPILRAFRSIYPGLVQSSSAMPDWLKAHLRYPETLFRIQASVLSTYHVTDPVAFLTNSDAWELASQRGLEGEKEPIPPFYVEMKLPDEPGSGFILILPFTPKGKINMSGWLAAHCDPDSYGRLVLYRFVGGDPIAGPEQMESNFSTTPQISNINKLFSNAQSSIIVGNLLVVPIGRSILYSETLFLKSRTAGLQGVPRLTRVILAFNDRIVVGTSYEDALQQLFGSSQPAIGSASTSTSAPTGSGPQSSVPTLTQIGSELDAADAALRKGDFAAYGKLQQQARRDLAKAINASKQTPAPR